MKKSLRDLASFINGKVIGNENFTVENAAPLELAKEKDISFIDSPSNLNKAKASSAGAFIVKNESFKLNKPLIIAENPHLAFARILNLFLSFQKKNSTAGIHPGAVLKKGVKTGENVSVMEYAVIEENTVLGDNVVISPFVYIGSNTVIGNSTFICPNVTIMDNVKIGKNVIINSGAVIGSEGFGYVQQEDKSHYKIPQIGGVLIEDNVEIGANVCIDRASFGQTIIKKGVKIDNLVQIAHNVEIGENSIIVSQVGLSGSVKIGKNVILAGQVGVSDHVVIEDNSFVFAQSGVHKNVSANSKVFGTPAQEMRKALSAISEVSHISKLKERIKELENKVKKLESKAIG